jgi:hypothetical protein
MIVIVGYCTVGFLVPGRAKPKKQDWMNSFNHVLCILISTPNNNQLSATGNCDRQCHSLAVHTTTDMTMRKIDRLIASATRKTVRVQRSNSNNCLAGGTRTRTVPRQQSSCRPLSTASGNDKVVHVPVPFYGRPREPKTNTEPRSVQSRLALAIHYATTAFSDPTRADAVAALGEITGPVTLSRLHEQMKKDATGRRILEERPVVSKATIPFERLMAEAPEDPNTTPTITFGQAYGCFLKSHNFDPDERDEVTFIEDDDLAYVMLRYRQVRTRIVLSVYRLGTAATRQCLWHGTKESYLNLFVSHPLSLYIRTYTCIFTYNILVP